MIKRWGRGVLQGWDQFWFRPADVRLLGLIRALTGGMLFYTHLIWGKYLVGFFGESGWLNPEAATKFRLGDFTWSHLDGISSPGLLWTLHIAALIVFAMFAAGLFTRVTSVLAFLLTVSYAHRGQSALFGLDQINALLAMYLMIGPSGAAFSVDRYLGWDKTTSSTSANISLRLIQLHMCLIYFFAGAGKLAGETWWDGTALWGAFANQEYQTFDMTWLAFYPAIVNLMTQISLFWELSYAALIWPKATRPIVLGLAIPLHLGIGICMGMLTFGFIMLIGNLAFLPPSLRFDTHDQDR